MPKKELGTTKRNRTKRKTKRNVDATQTLTASDVKIARAPHVAHALAVALVVRERLRRTAPALAPVLRSTHQIQKSRHIIITEM